MPGWLNRALIARLAILWLAFCAPVLAACQQDLKQLRNDCQTHDCSQIQADDFIGNHSLFNRTSEKQLNKHGRDLELLTTLVLNWVSLIITNYDSLPSSICNRPALKNTTLSQFALRNCTGVLVT